MERLSAVPPVFSSIFGAEVRTHAGAGDYVKHVRGREASGQASERVPAGAIGHGVAHDYYLIFLFVLRAWWKRKAESLHTDTDTNCQTYTRPTETRDSRPPRLLLYSVKVP